MPDPATKRIALVGHCGPDSYALRSAVSRFIPESEVVFAHDEDSLEAEATGGRADLLLINRVLDGDYAEGSGVALVARLQAADPARPRLMLISNYPEAQQQAEAAGALPGFGKRDMYAESTRTKLRHALGLA
jgi:two-component system chemotaxis response regulator CheY